MQRLLDLSARGGLRIGIPTLSVEGLVADLNLPMVEVSHHHAHALAVLGRAWRTAKPALALVLDGWTGRRWICVGRRATAAFARCVSTSRHTVRCRSPVEIAPLGTLATGDGSARAQLGLSTTR